VGAEDLSQCVDGEIIGQRLRTQAAQELRWVLREPHTSELAGVAKDEALAISERHNHPCVRVGQIACAADLQVAAHAQVHQKREAIAEVEADELAPSIDVSNTARGQLLDQFLSRRLRYRTRPENRGLSEAFPRQQVIQLACQGLDLR